MENGGDEDINSLTIVTEALDLLKIVSNPPSVSVNSTSTSGAPELGEVEYEIDKTKRKIEKYLEFHEKLNPQDSESELSYEKALLFIYFLETFALQGSGKKNISTKLTSYFSPYYYTGLKNDAIGKKKGDDLQIISDVRGRLLNHPTRRLDLKDVAKCMKGDIPSFFKELQKFVKHVQTGLERGDPLRSDDALNKYLMKGADLGKEIDDVESFLAKEFKKLLDKAFGENPLTSEDLFEFVVNFYPIFKAKTEWGSKELSDLRNNLVHQFYEYDTDKFDNEIFLMRHELLRYHFAHKVYKVVCDIDSDDEFKIIDDRLEEQMENFVKEVRRGAVEGFRWYYFSESILPEAVKNFEELAERYLKFKFLTHHFVERTEQDEEVNSSSRKQRKRLSDSDKREWFEEFDRLERLRDDMNEYIKEKERFKKISLTKYGVQENNFDESYECFEKNDSDFVNSDEIKGIANILNTLKDIRREKPNLSNHVVISLYDRFVARKAFFDSLEKSKEPENVDNEQMISEDIREKLEMLPAYKKIKLKINDKMLFLSTGDVIKGMLNIFCNAYDTYRVEFTIEDVFNDDTILEYMVRKEVDEVDVDQLVDPFFKFIVTCDPELVRLPGREKETRKLLEKFLFLKRLPKKSSNELYKKEKDKLKIELIECAGVEESTFNRVCQKYVEGDEELPDDDNEKVKIVRGIIGDLRGTGKQKLTYQEISSLYHRLIDGVEFIDHKNKDKETKFIDTILESFLKSNNPRDNESLLDAIKNEDFGEKASELAQLYSNKKGKVELKDLATLFGNVAELTKIKKLVLENCKKRYGKFVSGILRTFEGTMKLKSHNYMRIRKFLNGKYAAPYVVRLMSKVGNDNIIEKDDLKQLIGILLTGDYSYVKHLNDLLHIDSRKLNLYEVVCTHIMKPSFNIENMTLIFNEPKHVNGILTALGEGIDENGESTTKILELLNSVVLELILSNEDVNASNILDGELEKTFSRLKNNIKREIWEDYQLNLVKLKNVQSKHVEALEIVSELLMQTSEVDKSTDRYPVMLYHKAYTHKVIGEFKESNQEYEKLYKEIVKRVLDKDVSDAHNVCGIYGKIERSKKYHELRGSSEGSQRYLDILDIVRNIAFTLHKQHRGNEKWADPVTAYKNFEDSIKISEGLGEYEKDKFKDEPEHRKIVLNMSQMAQAKSQISRVKIWHPTFNHVKKEEYETILRHFRDALVLNTKILKIRRKKNDNKFHISIGKDNSHYILTDIRNLAFIHNKIGLALDPRAENKASQHEEALNIYYKILVFQKENNCTPKVELQFLKQIAFTLKKIDSSKFLSSVDRVSHYEKALGCYKEAETIDRSDSEEYLKACLEKAEIHYRLYDLKQSYNATMSQHHYKESMKLCNYVKDSPVAQPGHISLAEKRIAILNNSRR